MKKNFLVIFVLFLTCSIMKTFALPNPWIECGDDISCAAKKAGFNFPLGIKNYSVRAMKGMIEVNFQIGFLNKKDIILRKATVYDGQYDEYGIVDISGIYEKYPTSKAIKLKNGVVFKVRGNKSRFHVTNFAAESGNYSIYSKKGINLKDVNYFYKILEEAEASRIDYDKEYYTIEQLMDLRRIDGTVEPVYTQDCFPRTLEKRGVTKNCFERANLGEDSVCSASEVRMIKEYYRKGQDKDSLNNGSGQFCAE